MNGLQTIQKDIRYLGVVIEDMQADTKKILECMGMIMPLVKRIPAIEADVAEIKTDMKIVKQVIRVTNEDVQNHEVRISALEART